MSVLEGLGEVVDCFAIPGGIRVERHSAAVPDADGDPTSGPTRRFSIDPAVVQPWDGSEVMDLPSGSVGKEGILIHTREKLRIAVEGRGLQADVIIHRHDGEPTPCRYMVKKAPNYKDAAGYFEAWAVREELD